MEKKEKKDYLLELKSLIEKENNRINDAKIRIENAKYRLQVYEEDLKITKDSKYIANESFWALIKWLYISGMTSIIPSVMVYCYQHNMKDALITELISTVLLTGTLTGLSVGAIVKNYNNRVDNVNLTNLNDYEKAISNDQKLIQEGLNRAKLLENYLSYLKTVTFDKDMELEYEENLRLVKELGVLKSHN